MILQNIRKIFSLALILFILPIFSISLAEATASTEAIQALLNVQTDSAVAQSPFSNMIKKASPSVVTLLSFQDDKNGMLSPASNATGVVISPWGHILTNAHAVENTNIVSVLSGNSQTMARVIDRDNLKDIAILHAPNLGLPALQMGDSDKVNAGDWAIIIASPMYEIFEDSVSLGLICSGNREMEGEGKEDSYGMLEVPTQSMIQTDATINPGSSGGALLNAQGQLQGIATYKMTGNDNQTKEQGETNKPMEFIEGMTMCIPINQAKAMIQKALEAYIKNPPKPIEHDIPSISSTDIPELGINAFSLKDDYSIRAMKVAPKGVYVTKSTNTDILENDIICAINGKPTADVQTLQKALSDIAKNKSFTITLFRADGTKEAFEGSLSPYVMRKGEYININRQIP